MRDSVDYKKKYLDLRAKMVSSMDAAFRMGYEKGASEAAQQQAQQQAQQMMAATQGGMVPGQDQSQAAPQEDAGQQDMSAQGGPQPEELDQYISELENLVNKGEISSDDLKKSLDKIKNFQTNVRLTKSLKAIKSLPIKFSAKASANLTANDKSNLSMQEKIVEDIMKKWESETTKTTSQAMQTLGVEALTKGE
jgi:hypothetical protein